MKPKIEVPRPRRVGKGSEKGGWVFSCWCFFAPIIFNQLWLQIPGLAGSVQYELEDGDFWLDPFSSLQFSGSDNFLLGSVYGNEMQITHHPQPWEPVPGGKRVGGTWMPSKVCNSEKKTYFLVTHSRFPWRVLAMGIKWSGGVGSGNHYKFFSPMENQTKTNPVWVGTQTSLGPPCLPAQHAPNTTIIAHCMAVSSFATRPRISPP